MTLPPHRRATVLSTRCTAARSAAEGNATSRTSPLGRFKARIQNAEAENHAGKSLLEGDTLDDKFHVLERDEQVERLLGELKEKQGRMLEAG